MTEISLVFPHQLFEENPCIAPNRAVYLVEEHLFFKQFSFHKQKLVLHRASMKHYAGQLAEKQLTVHYIETSDVRNDVRQLVASLVEDKITHIHITDVVDYLLMRRLHTACVKHAIQLKIYPSPSFISERLSDYFDTRKTYFQTDYYIHQRKQNQILLDEKGKPVGGKWSFDEDNRMKFPKKETPPVFNFIPADAYIHEAKTYVEQHFSSNYGSVEAPHLFVTNAKDAEQWFRTFLSERFAQFGTYEDAIVNENLVLYHSVLSPLLNIGLLTPAYVLDETLAFASKHEIPMNSVEGFTRQLMGWREFIRIVYEKEGVRQRTTNYWKFTRKIPPSFWTGTTGIPPIDSTIKKILETGYCHHIERLMVLGNFMVLCEFDPDEVYRWFMEMFIDAYDWVMVPNVYGMTQFADGGLMTTKPYISGSNYLMKMSDYPKGDWQAIWDGLFWRFMHVHRDFFLQNPRLGMLVNTFDKMQEEKQTTHLTHAENYLATLV